jgi:hypothetical protein
MTALRERMTQILGSNAISIDEIASDTQANTVSTQGGQARCHRQITHGAAPPRRSPLAALRRLAWTRFRQPRGYDRNDIWLDAVPSSPLPFSIEAGPH